MGLTDDPNTPGLKRGADETPVPQNPVYLVLSEEERAKGFVQPVRKSYRHDKCGTITTMANAIAETYARDPWFYGGTYCVACAMHRPLTEFHWRDDDEPMAPALWSEEKLNQVVELRKQHAGNSAV